MMTQFSHVLTFVLFLAVNIQAVEVPCDLKRQTLNLLENDSKTVLAVELLIGAYPTNWSSETLREIAKDPAQRAKVPEAIVLQEVADLAAGDFDHALSLYAERYREQVRKSFAVPEQISAYHKQVKSVKFISKTQFGPLIHIRYVKERDDQKSLVWTAQLKRFDEGYLFVLELPDNELTQLASACFPAAASPIKQHPQLLSANFKYEGENWKESGLDSSVTLYCWPKHPVKGKESSAEAAIQEKLNTLKTAFPGELKNKVAEMFEPELRKALFSSIQGSQLSSFFEAGGQAGLRWYFEAGSHIWVLLSSQKDSEPVLLQFVRKDNGLFLTTAFASKERMISFTRPILIGRQMQSFLKNLPGETDATPLSK